MKRGLIGTFLISIGFVSVVNVAIVGMVLNNIGDFGVCVVAVVILWSVRVGLSKGGMMFFRVVDGALEWALFLGFLALCIVIVWFGGVYYYVDYSRCQRFLCVDYAWLDLDFGDIWAADDFHKVLVYPVVCGESASIGGCVDSVRGLEYQ